MKKIYSLFLLILVIGLGYMLAFGFNATQSGAPPYVAEDLEPPREETIYDIIRNWKRPEGPARVGLQVGHWKNEELPDELSRLIGSTGASGGGKTEAEVNLAIAERTKEILEANGVVVDILPATVPPAYIADVFVSIHADGSTDTAVSGFKAAAPRRDYTDKSGKIVQYVEAAYQEATGLPYDPNITRNMRGYYAFAWWRYTHAVHPMTPSIILETGFLTNPQDRTIIVQNPGRSAQGLAEGLLKYLREEQLL